MTRNNYWICLAAITLFAAGLRFWHLGELNFLVFDEAYFPKYAYDFLTNQYYFDSHPPLSKYLIGIGITIYNHLPWVNDPAIGTVPIEQLSAESWRWLNAVSGTGLCFIAAMLAKSLIKNYWFSLAAALFFALDGSLIVESRFGMNNIYILVFGLGAMWCLASAVQVSQGHRRRLIGAGILLGLTYSIKWNGLGYSLIVWAIAFAGSLVALLVYKKIVKIKHALPEELSAKTSLFRVVELWEFPAYLIALPFAVYVAVWQPHLNQYTNFGFIGMQKQILGYHSNSVSSDEHPYCSKWYSWPAMKRPVGYHFKSEAIGDDPNVKRFQDVHLFGNPLLYWMSFIAVLYLSGAWVVALVQWFKRGTLNEDFKVQTFIVGGFFANWLPWMMVSRCLFLYHYLPSATFSFLALAFVVSRLIKCNQNWSKALASLIIGLVVFAFFYWLPLQLGLWLPSAQFYDRMWFPSWI